MNKRLFSIYVTVFILIGLMLYLYRSSYSDMRVFIEGVNRMSQVVIKLERLDALLHFWLNNDRTRNDALDLYMSPDIAYDSILGVTGKLQQLVLYQEERLRLDSIRREVRKFQSLEERPDTTLSEVQREEFRKRLRRMVTGSSQAAQRSLEHRKKRLGESTALLDRWLVWMLVLAGSLIMIATFYSFTFLRQRRKAEGFNRTLLETTNYGIISFTPQIDDGIIKDYVITYCNDAGVKLLGLSQWDDLPLSAIVPPAILRDIRQVFDEVFKTGNTDTIEGYLKHENGRKWLQATVTPLHEGLLVSIYNLTGEKRFQQKLTYKINQLKVINEELQQYAYVTSHDLQEPLRKIQMFSDMGLTLNAAETGKSKDDFFRKIQKVADHMRDLIQILLVFTRSTDKADEIKEVDLREVVGEVISALDPDSKIMSVALPPLPVVQGSEAHLRLLFTHLLSNAINYSKPDAPLEVIFSERKVTQKDYLRFPALDQFSRYTCISIRDNGVGFDGRQNEKVFTIFQRLHNKEGVAGAGIGLAICRKIVHQHHGHIHAEGVENNGAVFHIFLPFEQPFDSD